MLTLRPGRADDLPRIRTLIRHVGINPTGLKWRRFTVAECEGEFVGCVQLKSHRDGSVELASLAVVPERRGQGIGRRLVEHCLAQVKGDLHLMCASPMQLYYECYGFEAINIEEMPPYFQRVSRAAQMLEIVSSGKLKLVVMRYVKRET